MITLYHGSNIAIDKIDLEKGANDKDFGKGFYLTDIRQQAEAMAVRKTRIVGSGVPTISTYHYDDSPLANTSLRIKNFGDIPTQEQAEFILHNRHASRTGFKHNYDIVIGLVADDGVAFQLEQYEDGLINLDTLVERLKYRKLSRQYFFGTPADISRLEKI